MNEGLYTSAALIVFGLALTLFSIVLINNYLFGSMVFLVFGISSIGLGVFMMVRKSN
jgi:hypothetical protein